MKALFFSCIAAALFIVSGCSQTETETTETQTEEQAPTVDKEAEKASVKAVMDQFIHSMETENMAETAKLVAHDDDMVSFGTDASERWVGWDGMKQSMEQQYASFEGTKLTVRDQVIHVNDTGNTAWFSELVDWHTTAGGQQVDLVGSRATGVLEKRDGNWLVVQMHFSVPVHGQAAEY